MKFLIQGIPSHLPETLDDEVGTVTVKRSIEIAATRDVGTTIEVEADENDIVEVVLEDGSTLFLPASEVAEQLAADPQRSRDGGAATIGPYYWAPPEDGATRGLRRFGIKIVRFFGFSPSQAAADLTARQLAKKIESKLVNTESLSRVVFRGSAFRQLAAVDASDIPVDRPVLVFIHGTASTTEGSFGGLWSSDHNVAEQLISFYGEHIYALEHHTLSKSAFENAADLADFLPKGARLHLVSHSRGGQVGELICRSNRLTDDPSEPFDAIDFDLLNVENDLHSIGLDDELRQELRDQLDRLNKALKDKGLTVERFIRVACPTGGTSVLSQRVDRWVNIVLNAASLAGLGSSPTFRVLKNFLLDLIAERRDARDFPGLEGMTPNSPLARMLNRPDVTVDSDLTVIAGDIAGKSLKSLALVIATDWIYGDDHDLVVNTISMRGGAQRKSGAAREYFESTADTTHFNYFKNVSSAERIGRALLEDIADLADFNLLKVEIKGQIRGIPAPRITGDRPVLYVLPGIMGSHLHHQGDHIWIDKTELLWGGMRKLDVANNADIEATGVHEGSYQELISFMSQTHDVKIFPFDWRLPIADSAQKLAKDVKDQLAANQHPIRFIAHSMGGLVARCMFAQQPDLYDQLKQRNGFRFVMLGTPTGGSHAIVRVLIGYKSLLKLLAAIDFASSKKELLEVISRFNGLLQLLPVPDENGNDYFSQTVWDRLDQIDRLTWVRPRAEDIEKITKYRELLTSFPLSPDNTVYVAGKAKKTIVSMSFDNPTYYRPLRFFGTRRGDGSVPWSTGIPQGIPVWYTDAEHGSLAKHRDAFPGYLDLLQTGKTNHPALDTEHGVTQRSDELFEVYEEDLDRTPRFDDIDRIIFDDRPRTDEAFAPVSSIKLGVVHGDLVFTDSVIMVGHYKGDPIMNAERVLDQRLDGRLSQVMETGRYPERCGEAEVFLGSGAVVLGLGDFGSLTAGSLAKAYREGVLAFSRARDNSQCMAKNRDGGLKLATLLIGTGPVGVSVEASLSALIKGVQQANAILNAAGSDNRIDDLEIVELWEDRAIEAGHALERLQAASSMRGVVVKPFECRKGGRRRIQYDPPTAWWRRIAITAGDDDLHFKVITDRARLDSQQLEGRLRVIDSYIRSAAQYRSAMDRTVGVTLFEYLVPNAYKPFGMDEERLVLSVDEKTANVPWELMIDRVAAEASGATEPLSVASSMIRQLDLRGDEEDFRPVTGKRTALVIASPAGTEMSDLPAARDEGRLVATKLQKHEFVVTESFDQGANRIREALASDDFRILHIAGHGMHKQEVDKDGKVVREEAGLVIEGGRIMSAYDMDILRCAPDIAFINCCHLGRFAEQSEQGSVEAFRRVAASMARKLISIGAKVVVAAGWAIDDVTAREFADKFYEAMFDGVEFGDAVQRARRAAYDSSGGNTWGAYQCYGNPSFRFSKHGNGATGGPIVQKFLNADEAAAYLEDLATQAGNLNDNDAAWLLRHLQAAQSVLDPSWLIKNGALSASIAHCYAELGHYREAIAWYATSTKAEKQTPVRVYEQMWNIKARAAARDSSASAARSEISGAIQGLESLISATGSTSERQSILASAYKRRSVLAASEEARLSDLDAALKHYQEAAKISSKNHVSDEYPANQALLCRIVRSRSSNKRTTGAEKDHAELTLRRRIADRKQPKDFWELVGVVDFKLSLGLWSEKEELLAGLGDEYEAAFARSSSMRERDSVRETIAFVKYHLAARAKKSPNSQAARLADALSWTV